MSANSGAEPRKRTVAEIEADLEARRAELTRSVDSLVERVDPRVQAANFVEDVKRGETRAMLVIGGAAVLVVGVVGLVILRRSR